VQTELKNISMLSLEMSDLVAFDCAMASSIITNFSKVQQPTIQLNPEFCGDSECIVGSE